MVNINRENFLGGLRVRLDRRSVFPGGPGFFLTFSSLPSYSFQSRSNPVFVFLERPDFRSEKGTNYLVPEWDSKTGLGQFQDLGVELAEANPWSPRFE